MKNGTVQITGVKAIDQVFRQLPPHIQSSVLSSAFVASTRPYRTALKAATPVASGKLKASVGTKPSKKYRRVFDKPIWVGHIAKKGGGHAFLADQGRDEVTPKRSKALMFRGADGNLVVAKKVGAFAGHHFIDATWGAHRSGVINNLENNIGKALHRKMKRVIKKYN